MEQVARVYREEEEDFYKLLGCDETSTAEQISTEFKLLAREHHPDKVSDPDKVPAAEQKFVLLKRARDVLVDSETRRQYDQWRAGFKSWISFDAWQRMQGRVHTSIHWGGGGRHTARLESGGGEKASGEAVRGGGEGEEGERVKGQPLPEALRQFRSSGGAGLSAHASKFRNYQI